MKAANAVILSVVLAAVILGAYIYIGPALQAALQPEIPMEPDVIEVCASDTTPTVTIAITDFYNKGTAVTCDGMYREDGLAAWTDITSGGTFQASPFAEFEIVFASNSSVDPTNEPYGNYISGADMFVVPCRETVTVVYPGNGAIYARNIATVSDITANAFDEYGDRIVPTTTTLDLDAGDEITAKIQITGDFEHDYGNVFCGENSNILVVFYNKTTIQDIKITELGAPINVPDLARSATGWKSKAWSFPVLQSSTTYIYNIFYDADNSENPGEASNITWDIFDSNFYLNALTNVVECGVEDEDGNNIGRTTQITFYTNMTADT